MPYGFNEPDLTGGLGGRAKIMGGPGSQEYYDTANNLYESGIKPRYNEALSELSQSYAGRGFDSAPGMERMASLGLRQSMLGDISKNRASTALRASDVGEQSRRREQDRGWQVEDRDLRYKFLKEAEDQRRADADAQSLSGMIGGIGRGVGTLAGAAAGYGMAGPMGAMMGGNLAGQAMGGGGGGMGAYPMKPSPYYGFDYGAGGYEDYGGEGDFYGFGE